jgi:hypothetical protein
MNGMRALKDATKYEANIFAEIAKMELISGQGDPRFVQSRRSTKA